jgi:hypothetical protein
MVVLNLPNHYLKVDLMTAMTALFAAGAIQPMCIALISIQVSEP